ncbi:MAG: response regulator [Pseudomonadota bacterium]|nr:response regulator [Pseudomonadota bacterium]
MGNKILCIEDNRETAALIAEEFQERGYDMALAHDGQAGFSAVLTLQPDLVLCDVSMPVMNGFEVLDRLMELGPRFAGTPFIFLTALGDRDNQLKGRRLGADDYVIKPIDFEILGTIVAGRLAKAPRTELWSRQIDLGDREVECLTWAARGKTSAEIAQIIGTSKRNVDFHIETACRKLNVATRIQAAVKAASGGLIEP